MLHFNRDNVALDYELLQAYEYYVEQRKTAEKSKQGIFKESLSAGIPLEQQRNNARGFMEGSSKEEPNSKEHGGSLADMFIE